MKIKIAFLILVTFTLFMYGENKDDKANPYITVEAKNMKFSYRVNGELLDCILEAPATGWISVGFDAEVKMKGANYIIGCIKKGKVEIFDHYGTSEYSHKSDASLGGKDNITNKNGKETKKNSTISFSIPLDSKDSFDKPIKKGKQIILLAYSNSDNIRSKHSFRTATEIEIQ